VGLLLKLLCSSHQNEREIKKNCGRAVENERQRIIERILISRMGSKVR
jgi:hypothetical protein